MLLPECFEVHEEDSGVDVPLKLQPLDMLFRIPVGDRGDAHAFEVSIVELLDVAHDERVAVDVDKALCRGDERRGVEPVVNRGRKVLFGVREHVPELLRELDNLHRALVFPGKTREDFPVLLPDASVEDEEVHEGFGIEEKGQHGRVHVLAVAVIGGKADVYFRH